MYIGKQMIGKIYKKTRNEKKSLSEDDEIGYWWRDKTTLLRHYSFAMTQDERSLKG